MSRRPRAALAALLLTTTFGSAFAASKITVRLKSDGDGKAGSPPIERTSVVWLDGKRLREDQEGASAARSVIVDGEAKTLIVIDHQAKVFHRLATPIDLMTLVPEAMRPALEAHAKQMRMDVEIRPTEERRTIGGLATRKFEVGLTNARGARLEMDLWTTLAPGFDVTAYKSLTGELSRLQATGGEWMSELMSIEGFPVLRETRISSGERTLVSREELVSVETLDPPPGLFEPPAGYTLEPFDFGPAPATR